MTSDYNYSRSTDFISTPKLSVGGLSNAIKNFNDDPGLSPVGISGYEDTIVIKFQSPLTTEQKDTLDFIVSNYTYTSPPKEPAPIQFETFVSNDPNFPGTFTSIADAFASGANSIFVKNGVYNETSDIVIPDGGQLVGENPSKVVVDFGGTSSSIISDGTGGNGIWESVGTISVPNGSARVTGTGTQFATNLEAGDFISMGTIYYQIASIISETELDLKYPYQGKPIVNDAYSAQAMHTSVRIENIIVTNTTSTGFDLKSLRCSSFQNIMAKSCSPNFKITRCGNVNFTDVMSACSVGPGFSIDSCLSALFKSTNSLNSTADGIVVNGPKCIGNNFDSCVVENNNGVGIHIGSNADNDCAHASISNSIIRNNNGTGISIDCGSNHKMCNSQISDNLGVGVIVSSENTVLEGVTISGNEGGGGVEIGAPAVVLNASVIYSNTGNGVTVLPNCMCVAISGNVIKGNTLDGIHTTDADNISISSNSCCGNSGNGVSIVGTNSSKVRICATCCHTNGSHGFMIGSGASSVVFSTNTTEQNGGNGLLISSGATDCTILGNNLTGNTGTNFVDSGTNTVSSLNIIA